MSWFGSAARGTARATKGYFSLLASGAKGALGVESMRQTGQMVQSVAHRMRLKMCPRCLELSLEEQGGHYQCLRADICGYQGSLEGERGMGEGMHLDRRVLTVAKVLNADFGKRSSGAAIVSGLMWMLSVLIGLYGLYWAWSGSWTAIWSMLVAVLCGVHAIRYAYMSQLMSDSGERSPRKFLQTPSKWFVI